MNLLSLLLNATNMAQKSTNVVRPMNGRLSKT